VLSSKSHKIFRFGVNWVTLGLVVQLPFRKDRFFCVNLLWRVYAKKTKDLPHHTKSQLARQMLDVVSGWLPEHTLYVVADSAYVGKHLLKGLPEHVHVVGPLHWRAALSTAVPADAHKNRKKGDRLPTPAELFDDPPLGWDDLVVATPKGDKRLEVQQLLGPRWYASAGPRPLQVVLVRDPEGDWRDEALLCTDLGLSAAAVVLGYMRRWSVEKAHADYTSRRRGVTPRPVAYHLGERAA
jgi:hypothetical protein